MRVMHVSWSRSAPRPAPRDAALAVGLLLAGLVEAVLVMGAVSPALVFLVLLTIPLAWRVHHASTVALCVTAALVVQLWLPQLRLFDETFTGFVGMLLAWYSLGRHGRPPRAILVLAGCAVAAATTLGWYDRSVGTFLLGIVFVVAPAAVGRGVAARAALRDLLDRQAELLRQDAAVARRSRIAQVRGRIAGEVQDLVSRRVRHMVERSAAARRLVSADSSAAAHLAATVELDGRAALEEMRTMLGALRRVEPPADPADPDIETTGEDSRLAVLPARWLEAPLIAGLGLVAAGEALLAPDGFPTVSLTLLAPVLGFVLGCRTTGRAAFVGLGIGLAAVVPFASVVGEGSWGDYLFPWLLVALSWLGGRLVAEQSRLVRQSRSRAAALERSAQLRAAAAAVDERLRLARELHDVLSHTLMVMVVQAGAARRCLESGRAGSVEVFGVIEEIGREATTELRRLLTLVDPAGDSQSMNGAATRGIRDLERLVGRARGAGLSAELVVDGEPMPLPGGLELAVHRIVQEAVTNAIRHARARNLSVHIGYAPRQLRLEVRDDGRPDARGASGVEPWNAGPGNGITGMRERARIYGGELLAGPNDGGGFVVAAAFPLSRTVQEQPA